MSLWRLVLKEIRHRRLNFALGVLSVTVAVGVLVAHVVLLRAHDVRTEEILRRKQSDADARLATLEDDYRKYMKELGYNLLILPKEQDLAEFWDKGYATRTMPEENVRKLSDTGTQAMRHLLPIVQQRVLWPEQKRRIILIGTRGEVPIKHRTPKEPMLLAVPPAEAVVGHRLASDLGLERGSPITLLGRKLVVASCRPERGTAEDITIWIDLATAQQLLGMEGRLNAIEALKCYCAGGGIEDLRQDIVATLPDTRVVIRENRVTVRARARERAKAEHQEAMAAEKAHRESLRQARESFAAVVVPLTVTGAAVWVGLLALANVRERRNEIGILRAVGLRAAQVFSVFVSRALLMGLMGAVLGYITGLAMGIAAARATEGALSAGSLGHLFAAGVFIPVLVASPALCVLATWAPAVVAARQDPAVILREGS